MSSLIASFPSPRFQAARSQAARSHGAVNPPWCGGPKPHDSGVMEELCYRTMGSMGLNGSLTRPPPGRSRFSPGRSRFAPGVVTLFRAKPRSEPCIFWSEPCIFWTEGMVPIREHRRHLLIHRVIHNPPSYSPPIGDDTDCGIRSCHGYSENTTKRQVCRLADTVAAQRAESAMRTCRQSPRLYVPMPSDRRRAHRQTVPRHVRPYGALGGD